MRLRPFGSIKLRPLAAVFLVWLAVVVIVTMLLLDGRKTVVERTERASTALAALIEEHTASRLQAIELTLRAIADAHELGPRPARNDPAFQALMESRLRDLPYVRAIFIIGPDGWLLHDTEHPHTPKLPLADRAYFQAHAADPGLRSGVWPPIKSRSGTGWFLAVTERLGSAEAFKGVLVAALQTSEFDALFRRADLLTGDGMAIFHRNGELIARYPDAVGQTGVGTSFAHLPLFREHLPERASGSFTTTAGFFPGRSFVSYRAMERAPFVIMITRPSFLAEWRRTAIGAALAMTALTVMLGFFLHSLALDRRRRELVRQRRAQAEKLEALGQLTGGMAHDFGNLLQVASANLELIALRPLDAERVPTALASAQRALERGAGLVDRLLDFAKRRPMSVRSIDLGRFLAEGKDLLAQAAGPGIEIRIDIGGPLSAVLADEAQLEVALLNLVVNARDAMGGRGTIRLRAYPCTDDDPSPVGGDEGAVCLSVCDTGPGMSEEVLRRAAEPFFTTKGDGGTGLGLAQVYGCMRQMGGNIRIESKPGEGTTVHLYLPAAAMQPGIERVQVRSGPLLARCRRCDGSDFTRAQASGALGPSSIVRCTRCGEEVPYGELNVRVTNEAAATSASWVRRWRRHFGARSAARRASRSRSHLGSEGR